jgi:flagellar assembly protein FliH
LLERERMMFLSKSMQTENRAVSWTDFEIPQTDTGPSCGKSKKGTFVSLQLAKKGQEVFIPLSGKDENDAGDTPQREPTSEEKMILLEKEAYDKGFAQGEKDGFELGETKATKVIENIDKLYDEMRQLKTSLVKQYEKDILETIFAISKKVIHTHMQFDETAVKNTIMAAINLASEKREITLRINPEDFELVEKLRPELFASHMNVKSIMITSDSTILRGGCLLETASGDVDASIETQLEILHQSLQEAYMS